MALPIYDFHFIWESVVLPFHWLDLHNSIALGHRIKIIIIFIIKSSCEHGFSLHPVLSLERAAASIGLHVNAHKTEYMCYNQTGDISTLEGTPLKLVDKFTYLGSSVESTEKDIETRLTKSMDSYQ